MHSSFEPNWFIALPISAQDWFDRLVSTPPAGLQRFHSDDLHLTVAFLGGCGEAKARAAWAALRWPLGVVQATLGNVVPMGAPQRYSALSAELIDERTQVEAAMSQCRDVLFDEAGAAPETRPAKAHVTVARPSRKASASDRAAGLRWASGLALRGQPVTLGTIALFTAAEDRSARRYWIVERLAL